MDDRTIVERCLQGQWGAYEFIVRRYQAHLVSLAWNLVGNVDDARDIAQDALIQAFTRLRQWDAERSFKAWLTAIAVHRGLDLLKKKRRFFAFFRQASRPEQVTSRSVPAAIEESLIFSRPLTRLTRKERAAIVLRINDDYSAAEIAEVLGCSETTARVHLLNAKRKLKRELLRGEGRQDKEKSLGEKP